VKQCVSVSALQLASLTVAPRLMPVSNPQRNMYMHDPKS
jgi:hypothetical protein